MIAIVVLPGQIFPNPFRSNGRFPAHRGHMRISIENLKSAMTGLFSIETPAVC